jgi:hypothetical protein
LSVTLEFLEDLLDGYAFKTRSPPKLPPSHEEDAEQYQWRGHEKARIRAPLFVLPVFILKDIRTMAAPDPHVHREHDANNTEAAYEYPYCE